MRALLASVRAARCVSRSFAVGAAPSFARAPLPRQRRPWTAAAARRGVADDRAAAADGGEEGEKEKSDFFALLGLPPMFALSRRELQLRVRELQKEHHPDVRRGSEDISATVCGHGR